MPRRLTIEQKKTKAHEAHGDKYDYSLWVENVNHHDKVKIVCPIHGVFEQVEQLLKEILSVEYP